MVAAKEISPAEAEALKTRADARLVESIDSAEARWKTGEAINRLLFETTTGAAKRALDRLQK